MLRRSPALVFELARHFDDRIPHAFDGYEYASNELSDPSRLENVLHADLVIGALVGPVSRDRTSDERHRRRVAGLAVEVQTIFKTIKLHSWLSHAAGVRRLFQCRGWTIVFIPDSVVRRRFQNKFREEPRASPWFVVPQMLPIVTTIEDASVDISRSVLACLFMPSPSMQWPVHGPPSKPS